MADRKSDTPDSKALSFEQAIDRLEAMIDDIESGEVGREEAIARYEQGQSLVKRCRTILDKAEERIAELAPPGNNPASEVSPLPGADVDE